MFEIVEERSEPADAITDPRLRRLLAYWELKRGARAMPARRDIDLLDLTEHLARLHLIDALGPGRFRFRVYGGGVTNPERRDMTGLTSDDYADKTFGAMVARHYQECVEKAAPVLHHILGELDGARYEYQRLTLPLSDGAGAVQSLLASPHRIAIPAGLGPSSPFATRGLRSRSGT